VGKGLGVKLQELKDQLRAGMGALPVGVPKPRGFKPSEGKD
jgi:hypothetical protein